MDVVYVSNVRITNDRDCWIPHTFYKFIHLLSILGYGARECNENTENRLNNMQPMLQDKRLPGYRSRWEEVTPSRLYRGGQAHLTCSYLMISEDVFRYVTCECDLTGEHILIDCRDFTEVRQSHYDIESSRLLFWEISIIEILVLLWDYFTEYRYLLFIVTWV